MWSLPFVALALSCSESGLPDGAGDAAVSSPDAARVPLQHRPSDAQCHTTPPAGACNIGGGAGMCASDAQCTAGVNGRCVESNGGAIFCNCSYDTCTGDSACPTGQLCACHGSPYTNGGNSCVSGNCRVDSDCGVGGYCSPSAQSMGCGGLGGYYCHTTRDQCTDDSDCNSSMNGPQECEWSAVNDRWQCAQELLCP
jgi:hypothetical protein